MDFQRELPGVSWGSPGTSVGGCHRALIEIRYAPPSWYTIRSLTSLVKDLETMARKRSNKVPVTRNGGDFRFINVPVPDDAYEDIMDKYSDADALMDSFQLLMEAGYKFGFALNAQNDMFICSMTDRRSDSATENACLTGGADSWYDALKVTLYKHQVLLQSDWSKAEGLDIVKRRLI